MDNIAETLILFRYIGAFFRWAMMGFRGTFTNRIEQDKPILDGIIGAVVFALFVFALVFIATRLY